MAVVFEGIAWFEGGSGMTGMTEVCCGHVINSCRILQSHAHVIK
jgi:hypothetical protein